MPQLSSIVPKLHRHLMPTLLMMYVLAFLDRANVGFARAGLAADAGVSDAAFAFGASIFFIGYAVLEVLRERSGGQISLPSGTVYPALHRLEAIGLVTSGWSQVSGRKRRVYELTDAGLRALDEHQRSWQAMAEAVSSVMSGAPASRRGAKTA